ncbi:MAG: Rad52/Rad22 family DNA repair protein [Thermoflexaceae bacterium]|nr:Rad52/Rad22 family DNA repair protein [Thermoflexaceae bacterium]
MKQKMERLLHADEIECRIGTISDKGLSLLLYKDARADMKILDEIYGANNWQRRHEVISGCLYCVVSIWDDEKQQWISKMDVGTKSKAEMEKGESSDSFKRACVNWGIGRELYTAPFIWIGASKVGIQKKEDKYVTYDKFQVSAISYNENREIAGLTIINQEGRVVYSLIERSAKKDSNTAAPTEGGMAERIQKELERTGVALDAVLQRYGVGSIAEMDESTCRKAINSLKRTKTKVA